MGKQKEEEVKGRMGNYLLTGTWLKKGRLEGKENIGAQPLEMDSTLCLSKTDSFSHLPEKGSTNLGKHAAGIL